jgi:probable F420-dependent oxidoreductase
MQYGIHVRPTSDGADIREVARMVEATGFDALYLPEHTHIPLGVRSLFPDAPEWLEACKRMLDPFVALGAVASVTRDLLLGTGVCLVPQHHPITLAKTVATLDVLSGGRVLLGVGAGWNDAEMRHHGVDPRSRFRRMEEHVRAMQVIWTQEEAEFHGSFVDFDPIWLWPKPQQRPHPPIAVGGEGPRVLQRVIDYGDEWMPNDHPELIDRLSSLHQLAVQAQRAPIPVTAYAVSPQRDRIEQLAAAGVTRCVFNLRTGTLDEARDGIARLRHLSGL